MNEEHFAMLKQGGAAWNAWRLDNPVRPDLSVAHLRNANLRDAALTDADLTKADLNGADLTSANLTRANLTHANLTRANLTHANLIHANLRRAQLTGADVTKGHLIWAHLTDADATEANLTEANLTDANLVRADLNGADLTAAHLTRANLIKARLTGADLTKADLSGADLTRASLFNTNLTHANLTDANLTDANLTDADLSHASLAKAILSQTNFNGARCGSTLFATVDLSVATSLESTRHHQPNSVGADSLRLSRGRIPSEFLKGCGFSDWEIEAASLYDPTLSPHQIKHIRSRVLDLRAGARIQVGSLFISYTHGDSEFVENIEKKLNENGIRYWRDVHHATAGRLDKVIEHAMRLNSTVLLILSKHSVESDWVEDEAARARALEKELGRDVLCPIALDDAWKDCRWSRPLRTQIEKYNILPFQGWEDETTMTEMFDRLVRGLSIFYGSSASTA